MARVLTTDIQTTALEESGGVGVAVDGAVTFELVDVDNFVRFAPVDEVFFDFLAAGMLADLAFALVIVERGRFELGEKASDGAAAGRWFRLRFWLRLRFRFEFGRGSAGWWCGSGIG